MSKSIGDDAIGWNRSKKLSEKSLWDFNKRVLFGKKLYAKWPKGANAIVKGEQNIT